MLLYLCSFSRKMKLCGNILFLCNNKIMILLL
nr:MAG TPA: hypothetical protein [Caudoviricetes sp.]